MSGCGWAGLTKPERSELVRLRQSKNKRGGNYGRAGHVQAWTDSCSFCGVIFQETIAHGGQAGHCKRCHARMQKLENKIRVKFIEHLLNTSGGIPSERHHQA